MRPSVCAASPNRGADAGPGPGPTAPPARGGGGEGQHGVVSSSVAAVFLFPALARHDPGAHGIVRLELFLLHSCFPETKTAQLRAGAQPPSPASPLGPPGRALLTVRSTSFPPVPSARSRSEQAWAACARPRLPRPRGAAPRVRIHKAERLPTSHANFLCVRQLAQDFTCFGKRVLKPRRKAHRDLRAWAR